jgi:hypothetical protein
LQNALLAYRLGKLGEVLLVELKAGLVPPRLELVYG